MASSTSSYYRAFHVTGQTLGASVESTRGHSCLSLFSSLVREFGGPAYLQIRGVEGHFERNIPGFAVAEGVQPCSQSQLFREIKQYVTIYQSSVCYG